MHSFYLDAIRNFEGYTPQASWDYAQFSNGYGTRARYAGEVIDKAEAERRFRTEVSQARSIVEKAAPDVDEGTKAALTSLTYNAGTAWIQSGLGEAVRSGDLDAAREIFQKYNKAGGEVLPGLVNRRAQEVQWIGNPEFATASADKAVSTATTSVASNSVVPKVSSDARADVLRLAQMIHDRAPPKIEANDGSGAATFEKGSRTERHAVVGALASIAGDTLMAIADAENLASLRTADIARLAQLSRGSELAKVGDKDRQDSETRRV